MSEISFSPKKALRLALRLAKKGIGRVEPNPPVGCVILDSDGRLLAEGYHKAYGSDHAEVCALKKIKDKKKLTGARVFLTLEPCHHTGKTSPCSKELARYPIRSLTYGAEDPFTDKKGLEYLRRKGVEIIYNSDFQEEMENLIRPFKFSFLHKKSFVSLKVASSLDGVVATKKGESRWITGWLARRHAHFLRSAHSAVLIGSDTLLKDNPRLDIRLDSFKGKENKVVILDPKGKSFSFLLQSRVLQARSPDQVILCCSHEKKANKKSMVLSALGVRLKFFKMARQNFSLAAVLKRLYQEEQIQSVLVEGGAFCWSQFLKEKAAQRLYLYIAPRIMGEGLYWSRDFTIQGLSESLIVDSVQLKSLGDDLLVEALFNL